MNFSIVSNSCVSSWLYMIYNQNINPYFIDYNNPFISSWFPDDENYVRLCENYEYYTSLEPKFDDAINLNWEKDTGKKKHIDMAFNSNYLVMFLGDVEIHWIHDINKKLLLKKYNGRLKNSKNYEKIFLWSDSEMFNIHNDDERKNLLYRFNNINQKSIFLTKYHHEEYENINNKVKFVPEWAGKSQYDRKEHNFLIKWYSHPQIGWIFKKLIDDFE